MKKLLIILGVAAMTNSSQAQFQVNPQLGVTFQRLTDVPEGYNSRSAAGWQLGADARFGDRLFLQPGVFLGRSVTAITRTEPQPNGTTNTVEVEDNLVNTTLKLRAQLGYRIVDTYQFDIRLMLGPSYDVVMSVDDRNDRLGWTRGDFNDGSFNIDAGVGFDMGLFTLAPTASFGLSRVFRDDPSVSQISSKYMTYGLMVGINFGNDDN